MLLRHSVHYLLAKGFPALFNFAAIYAFTRILSPEEYGQYLLLIAAIGFANAAGFCWLQTSLTRFLPGCRDNDNEEKILSVVKASFIVIAILTGILGLVLSQIYMDSVWGWLIILAIPILWAQSWYELSLELLRCRFFTKKYGVVSTIKSILFLFLGMLLSLSGFGVHGVLFGLLISLVIPLCFIARKEWQKAKISYDSDTTVKLIKYGLPLTATFILLFFVSFSDRFILAWYFDEAEAGLYGAGYDIGQLSLMLLMSVIHLAAYPLAVKELEERGVERAKEQLRSNFVLLAGLAIPASVGAAMLSSNIIGVVLGGEYRAVAEKIFPWIIYAAFFLGMKSFYFDLAFQLVGETRNQVWIALVTALVNMVLNFFWIPRFAGLGAAYATFVSYLLALILSFWVGRKIFLLPTPMVELVKVSVSTVCMACVLFFIRDMQGLLWLFVQIGLGVFAFGVSGFFLDIFENKKYVTDLIAAKVACFIK